MLLTFGEIKEEIYRQLQTDSENVDAGTRLSIEKRINAVQDNIIFDRDWEWRRQVLYLGLKAPVEDGTVDVTKGSRTVTGNSTSWDFTSKDGYLLLHNRLFKIRSVDSTTQITLDAPYPKDTETAQSYKIIFPDYRIPSFVSSIIDIKIAGRSLQIKPKDRLLEDKTALGEPEEAGFDGTFDRDYYNTGSVDVTNGSTTVTGNGTAFDSSMVDKEFRVTEFSKPYIIDSVTSSTTLTLKDAYQGDTGNGKSYSISPKGTPKLTFRSAPDDRYVAEIEYLQGGFKLVDDNDYSIIPVHTPLLHGALWLAFIDFDNENPVRIQQARADYNRTLKQLRKTYRTVGTTKWKSPIEIAIQENRKSRFNPLEDDHCV